MSTLIDKALSNLNRKGDGDMIDRLSATTTVTLLIVASVIVSAKQYVGQPIQCWVPAEMTDAMQQYVENYCYVQNTYFLPFDKHLPQQKNGDQKRSGKYPFVQYYQWVPFILGLQAILFYSPRLFWRAMSSVSGVNLNAMHTMARQCLVCESDKRDHCYRSLADYIHWALDLNRAAQRRASNLNFFGRYKNLYLIVIFLLTKMLYVINAFGQIFLLDAILQTKDPLYGVNIVRKLVNGTDWQQSGFFPRSTLCDVEIRAMGKNIHRYTVQCVLMINVFNEKLFIFLWFWTMFVAIASSFSLVFWLFSVTFPGARRRFIRRILPELPHDKEHQLNDLLAKFVDRYLGVDGVYFFHSMVDRTGAIVASKVVTFLWRDFVQEMSAVSKSRGKRSAQEETNSSEYTNFEIRSHNGFRRRCLDNADISDV